MPNPVGFDCVCVHCGKAWIASRAAARFCSARCQSAVQRPKPRATCARCGVSFTYTAGKPDQGGRVGKFCSRACFFANKKINAELKRIEREQARKRAVCRVCGQECSGRALLLCSKQCRRRYNTVQWRINYRKPRRFVSCADCGVSLDARHGSARRCLPCSEKRTREAKRRIGNNHCSRAKHYGTARDHGLRAEDVFNRYAWRCCLCGVKTPKRLRGTCDPRAPEIDHVVPVSFGAVSPGHVYDNVQCLCRQCNSKKGASVLGQLGLGIAVRQRASLTVCLSKSYRRMPANRRGHLRDAP